MATTIAVFDVGKTNKKVVIFDEKLNLIDSVRESFPEYVEEGIHYERIEEMTEWFLDSLKGFTGTYDIAAVSVTTQGATYVCVDEAGDLALPGLAYTTEPGEEFHQEFYRTFGGIEQLQRTTATAPMNAFINMGQSIYFAKKHFPEGFARTKYILNLPQYFGYVLTGNAGVEPTYVGCHTLLWEHKKNRWSYVTEGLGITGKLPSRLSPSWDVLGSPSPSIVSRTGLKSDTIVTLGVHDSNASLLPYILKTDEDFVLNSTGTWCVIMHPTRNLDFKDEEIGLPVYFNLDVFTKPVKTSLLMGGMEFEKWSEVLKKINRTDEFPRFNPGVYKKLIWENRFFIMPGMAKGTGQFPDSEPRAFEDGKEYHLDDIRAGSMPGFFSEYPEAYAALNLSLAIQTKIALERAGAENGRTIFIEGGFRHNPDYVALVSALFPRSEVYLTNLSEATAFGAALLAKAALGGCTPRELADLYEIETKSVESSAFDGIENYTRTFLELL